MPQPKCHHLSGNQCVKLNAKCLELRVIGGCPHCPFRGHVAPVRPGTPKPIPSRPPRKH